MKAIDFLGQSVAEDFLEKGNISALEFLGEEEAPGESVQTLPARYLTKPPEQLSRDLMAQTIGQPPESVRLKEAEEVIQPAPGEVEPSIPERSNLQILSRIATDIPKAIGEFGDAILSGATLGLSKRAEQAGELLTRKLFGDKYVEPPKEEKVLPSYAETAGELIGAVAPIGAAGKVIASPIIKIVSKNKYFEPFAKMIGWGTAGGAYSAAEQMVNEGELPTPKEIAKHGATWAAFEGVINSLGWGGRLALGINKLSKLWGIPRKEVLKTVIEEAKARNMPIAKYAYTKAGVQKALSKAEVESAKKFVKNIENSAKKFEKRGTYQDLVNQLKDKETSSRIKSFEEYVKTGEVIKEKEAKPSKIATKQPEAERILKKPGFLRTAEEKLIIQKAKAEPAMGGRAEVSAKVSGMKAKEKLPSPRPEPYGPKLAAKLKVQELLPGQKFEPKPIRPELKEGIGGPKTKEAKLKKISQKIKGETPTMLKESDKIDQTITLGTLVDIAAKDPVKALKHVEKATVSKVKLIEGLRNKGLKAMGKAKSKEERAEIAKNLEKTLKGIEGKVKPKIEPKIPKEIIARDTINGKQYEYRVAKIKTPEDPQITHQVEMRPVGSKDWESALVGKAASRKDAIRSLVRKYPQTGKDVANLEVLDPTLKKFVSEEIKTRKGKALEAKETGKIKKEKESPRAKEEGLTLKELEVEQPIAEQTKPPEKPKKPIATLLSSKEEAGVNYEMKVKVAETGEIVTVTKDAAEVLRETKKELSKYEKLLACLSS